MLIKGGMALIEDSFIKTDILTENGIITAIGPSISVSETYASEEVINAEGLFIIPGLIDIHFHGCMNHDFSGGTLEDIKALAEYEAGAGITGICPASMTLPDSEIKKICSAAAEYAESPKESCHFRSDFLGIHLEGPFISENKKGAQNPEYITRADKKMFDSWQEAAHGLIKIISLAPEYPENMKFIEEAADFVHISAAHTDCSYETAREAFTKGVSHVAHLFNAMPGFAHRNPGLIGAASDAHAEAELICDGNHVHPSAIRAALRLFGEDRIIFVSDSMEAAGMPDGRYYLGGLPVNKKGSLAVLDDGTIAGSVTNLFDCMRYAVKEAGVPLETAVKCSSENPAKSIDVFDTCGSISEGKSANLLLIDSDIRLHTVILHGRAKIISEK